MMEKGADELGIDSLVAVALRSWFLKELHIDMPVMKILGGASVGDLLSYAVEKLPVELTPSLGSKVPLVGIKLQSTKPELANKQHVPPSHTMIESSSSSVSTSLDPKASSESGVQTPTSSSSLSTLGDKVLLTQHVPKRKLRMSFGQSRFWFLASYLEDKTTFNITCSIHIRGLLRVAQFASAVESIGQRHEALRTCFFNDEDQVPTQGILEKSALHLEQKETEETQVSIEFEKMKAHVFNLERGETMRVLLISQSATSHHLIIGYHHINMDGVSLMVFLSDLEKLYSGKPLAPRVLQYPEFSEKQRERLNLGNWNDEIKFWKKEFTDFPPTLPILPLSTVSTRRAMASYDAHKTEVRISSSLSQRVRETCRKYKATPFHFYLAVFQILLARFADAEDLCIGVADAGRSDSGAFDSVGHYLNVLPLRSKHQRMQKFQDTLKDAKSKVYAALANSNVPIDILLNELGVPRSTTNSPLFQAFIDYRNVPETQTFGDCEIEGQEYSVGRTAYDILLDVVDNSAGDSLFALIVQRDLYTKEHADILMKCFLNLVEAFSTDPSLGIEEPSLYSPVDIEDAIQLGLGKLRDFSCGNP
jgi:hybrid polyketide synthase/nonribosomal peptide synthetase ACE1